MHRKRNFIVSNTAFERLIGLSDGVFAIVITLMVIELKVPKIGSHTEEELGQALLKLLPVFASVVISFFIIGMMWIEHHRTFRYIDKYNMGLMWRNFIFLGCVSLIPFPTGLFAEYPWSVTAFTIYALTIGLAGYMKAGLLRYAWEQKLASDATDLGMVVRQKSRSYAVPMVASLSIIVASFFGTIFGAITFATLPFVSDLCEKFGGHNARRIAGRLNTIRHTLRSRKTDAAANQANKKRSRTSESIPFTPAHKEAVETVGGIGN